MWDNEHNMAQGTPAKTERNDELKRDYLSGMETAQLVVKYGVTPKRIYDILRQMGINPNRRNKKKGGDK